MPKINAIIYLDQCKISYNSSLNLNKYTISGSLPYLIAFYKID